MLYSPISEDWLTWSVFALLERYASTEWWAALVDLARQENARLTMPAGSHQVPQIQLWQTLPSPTDYERASRERMQLCDNPAWVVRSSDPRPVEGPSEIDITFRNDALLVFVEAKLTSDVSLATTYDPWRNQIVRNIDCVLDRAGDLTPAFWMIVRDAGPDREYVRLLKLYRDQPDVLAAVLPHHRPGRVTALAENLSLIRWRDLFDRLAGLLPDHLDAGIVEVVREVERRV
jgi:hypothetical protein